MESICISLFAAASVIADGCATIVNDSTQRVEIVSDPPGATTKVGGIPIGTTPTSIDLKRGEPHSVTIEKDGYATAKQSIAQGTSGWIAGNILIGGLTGLIVDYSTGGGAYTEARFGVAGAHRLGASADGPRSDSAGRHP
jgi:hypothetical protein